MHGIDLYGRWRHMQIRTTPEYWVKKPSYAGVSLSEEFSTYERFKEWAMRQVGWNQKGWGLDKDILLKGNRIYAPDRCVFVPRELNAMMVSHGSKRGNLPIGVVQRGPGHSFLATCSMNGKTVQEYNFPTAERAFQAFKRMKEGYIKLMAEKWRGQIDERAFAALMAWEVKITD